MKRLLKRGLKAIWQATAFLRRPILAKFERFLMRCLRPTEALLANETNVLMNHVVRELVRLQRQVDGLQQVIEDLSVANAGPAIAGEIEPAAEHRKVG